MNTSIKTAVLKIAAKAAVQQRRLAAQRLIGIAISLNVIAGAENLNNY